MPEVADWSARRMRAVVLLKHAVDDDILEDIQDLYQRRQKGPGQHETKFDKFTPSLEDHHQLLDDHHQLFTTIRCLRRIISPSATDLSWLDRIQDSDFEGIEGFTSLFFCIDTRHGVMYRTSADYYNALVPKLQETMTRLFPDLKRGTFALDSAGSLPKKWRKLSVWMTKVVKRWQSSEDC